MNINQLHIRKPKCLLFDVGDVLLCDSTSAIFVYRCLYDALGESNWGTPQDLVEARRDLIEKGIAKDLWSIVAHLLPDSIELAEFRDHTRAELYNDWDFYSPAIPLMNEILRDLSKHFMLGLLANQPDTVEDVLRKRGIWDLFEIHGISNIVGLQKPSPEFFQWAIDEAHMLPADIMMIGDRLDNDIVPAKKMGMMGCWLDFADELRPWEPYDEFTRAFKACRNLVCLPTPLESIDKKYHPDLIATSPRDLHEKLLAL